jgi:hypothetical protein
LDESGGTWPVVNLVCEKPLKLFESSDIEGIADKVVLSTNEWMVTGKEAPVRSGPIELVLTSNEILGSSEKIPGRSKGLHLFQEAGSAIKIRFDR